MILRWFRALQSASYFSVLITLAPWGQVCIRPVIFVAIVTRTSYPISTCNLAIFRLLWISRYLIFRRHTVFQDTRSLEVTCALLTCSLWLSTVPCSINRIIRRSHLPNLMLLCLPRRIISSSLHIDFLRLPLRPFIFLPVVGYSPVLSFCSKTKCSCYRLTLWIILLSCDACRCLLARSVVNKYNLSHHTPVLCFQGKQWAI